jgi:hypothetical protein
VARKAMWILFLFVLGMALMGCAAGAGESQEEVEPIEAETVEAVGQSPAPETVEETEELPVPSITFAPATEADCTHFVAPEGDDEAPGTLDEPWATLLHASEAAGPGDTVCFRGGNYVTEEVHLTLSGEPDAPITFTAYPGETPVLDGDGTQGSIITFTEGASYLHISGFALTGFNIWGMSLEGSNTTIQLDHLDIGGGEAGIHFTDGVSGEEPSYGPVENVTLEDSFIHDPAYTAVDCTPGPCNHMIFRRLEVSGAGLAGEASFGADGLGIERGQDILVEQCAVHDNGGDGIDLNSRDRDGYVSGIVVRNNLVYRNRLQGIKLWAGGTMVNNVVWGQGIDPVMIGVFPGDYVVVNNTIAYNMWDPAYSGRDYAFVAAYPETGESAAITLVLANNIFAYNTGPEVGDPTGIYLGPGVTLVESGGNLFYSRPDGEVQVDSADGDGLWFTQADIADGTWAGALGSQGDLAMDPMFASGWLEVDLHLTGGSPAIDAGLAPHAPPDDADGLGRDASPDIGAFEYSP